MKRGEIWWASLQKLIGSEPGYRLPVLIIQADAFNRSRIDTVIAAVITSSPCGTARESLPETGKHKQQDDYFSWEKSKAS